MIEIDTSDYEMDEESLEYDTEYKATVMWDMEKGDFATSQDGKITTCTGQEGYQIWCLKMAQTERYNCLSYPSEIGAELEHIIGEEDKEIAESEIERAITEAIEVNPRTESVSDFTFVWEGDSVTCSFVVKGIDMDSFRITI